MAARARRVVGASLVIGALLIEMAAHLARAMMQPRNSCLSHGGVTITSITLSNAKDAFTPNRMQT